MVFLYYSKVCVLSKIRAASSMIRAQIDWYFLESTLNTKQQKVIYWCSTVMCYMWVTSCMWLAVFSVRLMYNSSVIEKIFLPKKKERTISSILLVDDYLSSFYWENRWGTFIVKLPWFLLAEQYSPRQPSPIWPVSVIVITNRYNLLKIHLL